MPSSLIRTSFFVAVFLATQLIGRTQGLSPRQLPVAPAYPAYPGNGPAQGSYLPQDRMQVIDPNKKLSAGDQVTVEIVEDKEGGSPRFVSATGELEVPPVGRIPVTGKTTTEASADIKRRLESEFYYRATVKLSIDRVSPQVRAGSVILSGQVRAAGSQDMIAGEPLRLSSAILKAGGFTEWADPKKVKLTRQVGGKAESQVYDVKQIIEKGDEKADPELKDGDRIFVPKTWIRF